MPLLDRKILAKKQSIRELYKGNCVKNYVIASGLPPPPTALFISHVLEPFFFHQVNSLLVNNSFFSQITLLTKLRGLKPNRKKPHI